ncbi:MAG TPA: hypothetical protein VG815_02985, partial [Chloroflexota bacterium]|nr:hypothetical protein [Chloroflexota bacterium]
MESRYKTVCRRFFLPGLTSLLLQVLPVGVLASPAAVGQSAILRSGIAIGRNDSPADTYSVDPITAPNFSVISIGGVNNRGDVAGTGIWGTGAGAVQQGFLWHNGKITALNWSTNGLSSGANAINDNLDVVGSQAVPNPNTGQVNQALEWQAGSSTPTLLPFLSTCEIHKQSTAFGINSNGDVVGTNLKDPQLPPGTCSTLGQATWEAFLLSSGNMRDVTDNTFTTATAINGHRQVLLTNSGPAELWQNGSISPLSGIYASTSSEALNNNGVVVGYLPSSEVPAYWFQGTSSPLQLPPAITYGFPVAVNDSCDIVGLAGYQATLWPSGGAPVLLNSVIPADLGVRLINAPAINDKGQIAVTGTDKQGKSYAALLTPPPGDQPVPAPPGTSGCGAQSKLDVSISFLDGKGKPVDLRGVKKGDTFGLGIDVSAPASNPATVKSVTFSGAPVQVAPEKAIQIVSGPTPKPPPSQSLKPGARVSYTYKLKVVGFAPSLGFTSSVTGADASGNQVEGTDSKSLAVLSPLMVKVTPNPAKLQLEDHGQGPVPHEVIAKVDVTNTAGEAVDQVIVKKALDISPASTKIATTWLVQKDLKSGDRMLGRLGPGQTATATFRLEAQNDGTYNITATATSENPDAPDPAHSPGLTGYGTAPVKVNDKALFEVTFNTSSMPSLVKGGSSFVVTGDVKDLSAEFPVEFDPLSPTITGNAGNANPVDINGAFPKDGCAAPWTGNLDPQQESGFQFLVQTDPNGGTRGAISYAPTVSVTNEDGSQSKLTGDQIDLNGGKVKDGVIELPTFGVDTSTAPAPESDLINKFGSFSTGFYQGSTNALIGALEFWIDGIRDTAIGANAAVAAPFLSVSDYLVQRYDGLSAADKELWHQEVASVIARSNAIYNVPSKFKQLLAQVDAGSADFFNRWDAAYYSGDSSKLLQMVGSISGNVITQVALCKLQPENLLAEKGVVSLKTEIPADAKVRTDPKYAPILNSIENRIPITVEQAFDIFGYDPEITAQLRKLAQKKGAMITIRPRASQADTLIAQGKAYAKTNGDGSFHIKSVDELDQYLGYPGEWQYQGVLADPSALKFWFNINKARIPADLLPYVEARLESRLQDYATYKPLFDKWQKTGMPLNTSYIENHGITEAIAPPEFRNVPFRLRKVKAGFFVIEYDAGKGLKSFAGDPDIADVRLANGQQTTGPQRLDVFKNTESIADTQHGDLVSWIEKGQVLFGFKNNLLNQHSTGGIPLIQFAPDGNMYAVTINKKFSFFNTKTLDSFVFFDGGYRQPKPAYYQFGKVTFKNNGLALPSPVFPLNYWNITGGPPAQKDSSGLPTTNVNASYSNTSNAQVLQPTDTGQLQVWDP